MATGRCAAFLAVTLALQSCTVTANFNVIIGCKADVCGKGKCVEANNSTFGFECECDEGWKQARSDDDRSFKFLPCIIPNCTLNFNCLQGLPPAADKQKKANFSVFDPCLWTDCGGGSCNTTSLFTYTCLCKEGYYNLLNSTALPCYKECAIGADCANLGLDTPNTSASSTHPGSTLVDESNSHASSLIPRVIFGWLITTGTALALAVSKYS